tara:strand:+ start:421 stop:723 length:303 start_codon:yes stop_codon:yes gene_type:complete
MNEFEYDDEIEVSFNKDFSNKFTGMFQCDFAKSRAWIPAEGTRSRFCALDVNGYLQYGEFARKIEPMVRVCEISENGGLSKETWPIPKSAWDKIKAGEFE